MSIGPKTFRKKAFGGFDEKDVIAYLAEASSERAEKEKSIEALEAETRELRAEIDRLNLRLEEANGTVDALRAREKEYRVTVLDDAERSLKELEEQYAAAGAEMAAESEKAAAECEALAARLRSLTGGVESCGGALHGLYAGIASSRMRLDSYLAGEETEADDGAV